MFSIRNLSKLVPFFHKQKCITPPAYRYLPSTGTFIKKRVVGTDRSALVGAKSQSYVLGYNRLRLRLGRFASFFIQVLLARPVPNPSVLKPYTLPSLPPRSTHLIEIISLLIALI